MKTLILSDLHIGPGGAYDIFAGQTALPRAIEDAASGSPLHVVLNGDTLDFLLFADASLDEGAGKAAERARAIVEGPHGARVFEALRVVLAGGGSVTFRTGNHDPEVALDEVQSVLCEALGVSGPCEAGELGVSFDDSESMRLPDMNGLRVVVSHGERDDDMNRFEHGAIRRPGFVYPPGSSIVVGLLNRVKEAGWRVVDLLKPDFRGALFALLGIAPELIRLLPDSGLARSLFRVSRRKLGSPYALGGGGTSVVEPPDFLELVDDADLAALDRLVASAGAERLWLPDGMLTSLSRCALRSYAALHRAVAGNASSRHFDLTPTRADLQLAGELARDGAQAVVVGHTHAARFDGSGTFAFANTGTWIHLVRLPDPTAPVSDWQAFLETLASDPSMTGAARALLETHFTSVLVDPEEGSLRLLQYDEEGGATERESVELRAMGAASRPAPTTRPLGLAAPGGGVGAHLRSRMRALEEWLDEWGAGNEARWTDRLVPLEHRGLLRRLARAHLDAAKGSAGEAARERLLSAESVWQLWRALDEQRRGALGPALAWAEAVVADAYQAGSELLEGKAKRGRLPFPLVFCDASLTPATWPRGRRSRPPGLLAESVSLPFPLVVVTQDQLRSPWTLTLALHEVGHDLDFDFGVTVALEAKHREALARFDRPWAAWLPEIYADAAAVAFSGEPFARHLESVLRWVGDGLVSLYPPFGLRMALLAHQLGDDEGAAVYLTSAGADEDDAEEVRQVAGWMTEALDPLREADLAGRWAGLPAAVARAFAEEGVADEDQAVARFEAAARDLDELSHAPTADDLRFLANDVPRMAATIREAETRRKVPPLELLLRYDEIVFVGATNDQLEPMLRQAQTIRERPWTRLEVFFLAETSLPSLAGASGTEAELAAARKAALQYLRGALEGHPEWATSWGLYEYDQPFQFLSYWKRGEGDCVEERIHASGHVWGADIKKAPAVDWVAVPQVADWEVRFYVDGIAELRGKRSRPLASGPPG